MNGPKKDFSKKWNTQKHYGGVSLKDNLKGYLISFDEGKERICLQEMMDLLNQYADKFYPQESVDYLKACTSFEDALEAELKIIRSGSGFGKFDKKKDNSEKKINQNRFMRVEINLKGMIFIRITDEQIPPVAFLAQIFKDLRENQSSMKTRYTARVTPVEGTCGSDMGAVMKLAIQLLPQHFHPPIKPCSYKVELKRRANNTFPRDECGRQFSKYINYDNQMSYKNPEKIVVLEVFKANAALSVINTEEFKEGFNIRKVSRQSNNSAKRNNEGDTDDMDQPKTKKQKIEEFPNPKEEEEVEGDVDEMDQPKTKKQKIGKFPNPKEEEEVEGDVDEMDQPKIKKQKIGKFPNPKEEEEVEGDGEHDGDKTEKGLKKDNGEEDKTNTKDEKH